MSYFEIYWTPISKRPTYYAWLVVEAKDITDAMKLGEAYFGGKGNMHTVCCKEPHSISRYKQLHKALSKAHMCSTGFAPNLVPHITAALAELKETPLVKYQATFMTGAEIQSSVLVLADSKDAVVEYVTDCGYWRAKKDSIVVTLAP